MQNFVYLQMRARALLVFMICLGFFQASGQYLSNPSFEGIPLMIGPPDGWDICHELSTPNVQPGKYDIWLGPSDGITYIGLLTRPTATWEDMISTLDVPLDKDSCYVFKIDLAYQAVLSFTWADPIILRVYGSNDGCSLDNLLWTSEPIDDTDWVTHEFLITGQAYDITELILEVYYTGLTYYWGYMLLDNIQIKQTPQVDLGPDTTLVLCEYDSLVLDPGSGYASYLWPDSSTGTTFSVDTSGVYWVQVTSDEGCPGADSIEVIIEEYVEMEPIMFDSTMVCEGQEFSITVGVNYGTEPYYYEWIDLPDTTETIVVIADSTMYYYVVITDHCGNSVMDSIKVIVADNPDIDLGNDTLICPDGEYFLHAGSGYLQYLWQDDSGDSVYQVTEPGIYWVNVTSFLGCSASDSVVIDLFPPIPLSLGNDTTLCLGESLTLFAGNGFPGYLWQDNSTDSTLEVSSTGIYWVTVTDINGCHASDSIAIEFLPLPSINIGNDTAICNGEELILDAGSGFISYLWEDNDSTQYHLVTEAGFYWVTVDNGCGTDTDSLFVDINPSPEPDLGPDTTLCPGSILELDPGSQYISYLWQDNSNLPFYTVSASGNYWVSVENNYGCLGEDEVYINYSPYIVDLGEDTQLCEGESVVLDAGSDFVSYQWQDNSPGQTYLVSLAGTYSVNAEDIYGCISFDEILCSFYPPPDPEAVPDQVGCVGETLLIEAPAGEYQYYWDGVAGGQSTEVSTPGIVNLTMVNPCDSLSANIDVVFNPLPEIYLGNDNVIFPGQTLELDAGVGFDEYQWQDGSGNQYFMVTENNIDPLNPYFYVEVTENNCKSSDTIMVELYKVWVPSVITPNGDGKNDIFKPDEESWSGINSNHMLVINRWGEKVWESEDFESGWDGKRNGSYVADGVYYWILTVYYGPENLQQVLKGNLTVIGTN